MIVKFTQPSDRVKGISFHPSRPWLLTALYSGLVQIWDYRLQQIVDKYEGHIGPVRSVQFHPKLTLFVSGGDDTTVRVWNYNTKKEQFLLKGHLDYVRCVGFHSEQPWVLSSSDDQTARIWNYQSRQMIAIITGHSNYVMQCQFHPDPTKEFIITCSLDLTARLWSYTPLRLKYATNKKSLLAISGAEIVLISILAAHKDQVNWCTFHPTQSFIATAADDQKILIWKYTDNKCWHFDTLIGHTGNVNSVVFHPKFDVIISNSEDKTTRVWDFNTKQEIEQYQNKDQDRFWIVQAHLDNYYFACGSDSAFHVLTLFRDRVPFVLVNNNYLCVGDKKQIKVIELQSKNESMIKDLITHTSNVSTNLLKDNIHSISFNQYNTASTQLLIKLQPETKGSLCKFIVLSWDPKTPQKQEVKFFTSISAIFVGKTKILRVKQDKLIEIFNLETESVNSLTEKADYILQAPGGKNLLVNENYLYLYDPLAKTIIASTTNELLKVKQSIWSGNFVAILGKKTIIVYTKILTKVFSLSEQVPVKSAIWVEKQDQPRFLLYTTKSQIKYALLNGETGVVKSTEFILYLAKIEIIENQSNHMQLTCIDNRGNIIQETIDLGEAFFKLALYEKNVAQIQSQIPKQNQFGDSMISYLFKKKYSSLAIDLVQDKKGKIYEQNLARFQLAISSHNLETAFRACNEIREKDCYQVLCNEALRQGNQQIVELCHQQLNQMSKLSFVYAILGERDKQMQIQQKAVIDSDINLRFQTGIYLGDPADKVRQLWQSGQQSLAFLCASAHGLEEEANQLGQLIHNEDPNIQLNIKQSLVYLKNQKPQALVPPPSIIKSTSEGKIRNINWPHNYITTDQLIQLQGTNEQSKLDDEIAQFNQSGNVLFGLGEQKFNEKVAVVLKTVQQEQADELEADEQWGLDPQEEIQNDILPIKPVREHMNQQTNQIQIPKLDMMYFQTGIDEIMKKKSICVQQKKVSSSSVASKQLSVGNISKAIELLRKQIALKDPHPIYETTASILRCQSQIIGQIPFMNGSPLYINDLEAKVPLQTVNTISDIRNLLKQGYKQTTEGKFSDTLATFNEVIQRIPLIQAYSTQEQYELNQSIDTALSYILAMRCELGKKKVVDDPKRLLELGCYMTLCNLQPTHHTLTLRSCMSLAVKLKNYVTGFTQSYQIIGAQIANKIIDLLKNAPEGSTWAKPELTQSATKILKSCEQQGTNAYKIIFEDTWLYTNKSQERLSASTLTIIQNQIIKSPFVNASYETSENESICKISNMCLIGQETVGLKLYE